MLSQHICRHVAAVRQAGVTAVGMIDNHHIALDDLFAQALDALLQASLVAVIGAVTGDEILKQVLQGWRGPAGRGVSACAYQPVYFIDDMGSDDTLPGLSMTCGLR